VLVFEMFGAETRNIAKVNEVIEWLDENRGGLSVLIHPNTTGGNAQDHSAHAVWLGQPVAVRLWGFHAQTSIKAVLVLASAAVILRSWL
jgi:aromatic ring-cleaving dioxygenase